MTTLEALRYFGGKKGLARALDIWPHAISRWGDRPPMTRQYQLQVITKGDLMTDDAEAEEENK